jgi:hypothetical protein
MFRELRNKPKNSEVVLECLGCRVGTGWEDGTWVGAADCDLLGFAKAERIRVLTDVFISA